MRGDRLNTEKGEMERERIGRERETESNDKPLLYVFWVFFLLV